MRTQTSIHHLASLCGVLLLLAGCVTNSPAELPTVAPQAAAPTMPAAAATRVLPATMTPFSAVQAAPTLAPATLAPLATPSPAAPSAITYTVQPGDTLWTIAARHQLTAEVLAEANSLPVDSPLATGVDLIIPSVRIPSGNTEQLIQYQVQPGETFSSIAAKFDVSLAALQNANLDVDPEALQAGAVIRVPWSGLHVVGPGDSLTVISERYEVNFDALISVNLDVLDADNLDRIYVGIVLTIPSATGVVADCTPVPRSDKVITYTIRPGEGIACLASKFDLSPTTLVNSNLHLLGQGGFPHGTDVVIPPVDGALYTVTEEDVANSVTLDEIAAWYDLPAGAATIVDWQGQPVPAQLVPGQQLFLPGADLLAGVFNEGVLHTYNAQVEAAGGSEQTGSLEVSIPADPSATFSGMEALFWDHEFSPTTQGYCPYVTGAGWSGSGTLAWPTASHTIEEGRGFRPGHLGLDLPLAEGTPVHASHSGTVIWAGYSYFAGGKMVMLAHGNHWRTVYAHLSEVGVQCGQFVSQGTQIGLSGQTGASWPHLHFAVYRESTAHNPLQWLP